VITSSPSADPVTRSLVVGVHATSMRARSGTTRRTDRTCTRHLTAFLPRTDESPTVRTATPRVSRDQQAAAGGTVVVSAARTREHFVRRPADAVTAAIGFLVLAGAMIVVRNASVSGIERSAFRAVNDLPGALYPVLWPFQQLGAVLVGPLAAAIALVLRHVRLAIALLLATAAKLGLERVVKEIVSRPRPGTSIGADIHARGAVSLHGPSFVSGHAVLVAALACVVAPYLRGRWRVLPWAIVAIVMFTRVYVGAHNPLDVIAGAALGCAIGGCLNLIVGVPALEDGDTPAA